VTAVSVDGAQTGKSFVLTGDSTAGTVTLQMFQQVGTASKAVTMADASGHSYNVSETVNVADIAKGESETLDFADLGVSVTIGATGTSGSAATIAAGFGTAGSMAIDTAVASGSATLQTGANQGDETAVQFVNTSLSGGTGNAAMDTLAATLHTFNTTAGRTRDNATSLITAIDGALGAISSSRATLGAAQNRLQHTISNLGTTSENLSASNSRIQDVDVATESSNMAKDQVLEQAGVSVLAQANQLPQLALKLLG
jgi:flagellin